MNDDSILARIEQLVREEHELLGSEEGDATRSEALTADRERLARVTVELDRCWDLLRQRRALREAGKDPDEARPRGEKTVEHYLQ